MTPGEGASADKNKADDEYTVRPLPPVMTF